MVRRVNSPIAVNPVQAEGWVIPSAARRLGPSDVRTLLPIEQGCWSLGGLFLAVVQIVGRTHKVENTRGIPLAIPASIDTSLLPGMGTVVVLSPRRGPSSCIATVPDKPQEILDLHGVGGQAGIVDVSSQNTARYSGAPTKVRLIAALGDSEARPLSLQQVALPLVPSVPPNGSPPRDGPRKGKVVLVTGGAQDQGKTATQAFVVHAIHTMGTKVAAGKLTGVGNLKDVARAYGCGARPVVGFWDFGWPTTIGIPKEEVLTVAQRCIDYLRLEAPDATLVIEFGDGILFRETRLLLANHEFMRRVDHLVFAAGDPLCAAHGVELLKRMGLRDKLRMISGCVANNPVSREEARGLLGDIPLIDPLRIPGDRDEWNIPRVAELFA